MKFFMKELLEGNNSEEAHKYFVRFGKGCYKRRFIIGLKKGNKIKINTSFEFANELVNFVRENKNIKFSGKILTKEKIDGKEGKKKAGVFVYEISESSLEEFEEAYFYLLDANDDDIVLKIKKKLPKPGKGENKIDDKFCTMELDLKYWDNLKKEFFWDAPEGKKISVEHEIAINEIIAPQGVNDPAKIRELARRKGKIVRKITADGKEIVREIDFAA